MIKRLQFHSDLVSLRCFTPVTVILFFILYFMLTSFLPPHIKAQETDTPEDTKQQHRSLADLTVTELKPEDIEVRLKQIEKATDIDKDVKAELLTLYRQTLGQIQSKQEWTKKINSFEEILEQAPSEIAQIKSRLDRARADSSPPASFKLSPDSTFEQLSQMLSDTQTELNSADQKAKKINETINTWSERRTLLSENLVQLNARQEKVMQQLYSQTTASVSPELALARKTALLAKLKAIEQEISANKKELLSYNTVRELLDARREEAKFDISQVEARVAHLHNTLNQWRLAETERLEVKFQEQLAHAPESIHILLKENSALAHEHADLALKIADITERTKDIVKSSHEINETLNTLRERLSALEGSQGIDSLLMKHQKKIPKIASHKLSVIKGKETISLVQARIFELEEELLNLEEHERMAAQFIEDLETHQPDLESSLFLLQVKKIFKTRYKTVDSLLTDYNDYLNKLISLTIEKSRLITRVESFNFFVKEHILWLPSTVPLYKAHFPQSLDFKPGTGKIIVTALISDIKNNPFLYISAAFILFFWIVLHIRAQSIRSVIDEKVSRPQTDSFSLTIKALALDILLSLGLPLLLLFISRRISAAVPITESEIDNLIFALSQGLKHIAVPLFPLLLLKHLSRRQGVAEVHFQWGADFTSMVRRNLKWLIPVFIPIISLLFFARHYPDELWKGSISRIAYIIATIILAIFIQILLHPTRGILFHEAQKIRSGGSLFFRFIWYIFGFAVPGALILTSFLGYNYTAIELTMRIARTFWLIIGFIIIQATIIRAVVVSRQELMRDQASEDDKKADTLKKDAVHETEETPDSSLVSLKMISEQTRILLRWLFAFGLLISLWGIWHDIVPAFSFISEVELWTYTVKVDTSQDKDSHTQVSTKLESVYLDDLIFSVLLIIMTLVIATHSPNILDILILSRLSFDKGVRFAISAILRYSILIMGFIYSFKTLGIGWSKVQWLAAAVSVGLGFGLQEIFANFISGLIILFERPIRVGDFVTVGEIYGKVTNIQMRATTVTDRDRRELIVPNKEFITGQVINWTLSKPYVRIIVNVGIAYGSDTNLAKILLLKAARECRYVLKEPEPRAVFRGFGDSSLDFQLRVYIDDLEERAKLFDDINTRIDNEFRDAGIEIAFPQRDIHVRSIEGLPISEK